MSEIRRILSGGRITIDEHLRKQLKLKDGDFVITRVRNGCLEVIPATVKERKTE